MKFFRFLIPLFLLPCCHAQTTENIKSNKDEDTLLWEISGNQLSRPSYLFGTFHMMCKDDIIFSPQLRLALHQSEKVYFEMDLDDPANTLGAIFFMNMKDGKTLKELYSITEYGRLNTFFKDSLGMTLSMFGKMKPNFLEAMLFPKMIACKTMSGVEEELMKIVIQEKKEIKGFENIEFQASVFDIIPYADQARDLLKSIDSMQSYKQYFDTMLTVYKNQQLREIEKMFTKPEFGMNDNREILLDSRNKNWVEQLNILLPKESLFIAVGAGHLVGEKGLIELLKKEGYTLRPLENK